MAHVDSYCYRVKGLFVPYQTPESIEKKIDNYISKIGQYTEHLEDCFNRRDTDGFIKALETILVMLQDVYAKQCLSYINTLITGAKNRGLDYNQRLMQQAIADLLLLSIDMQKAQILGTSHAVKYKSVEKNEEIIQGLSAIKRMAAIGDYEKAQNLASDIKDKDGAFAKLADMFKTRQYDKALELADAREKEHIGLIQKTGAAKTMKTILAVDDRPEILANVSAALRGHFRVLGAPGGKMALDIIAHQKIDLFYLDIEMPEMDGLELAKRIRSNQAHAKTPIIFLTSNATRENIARGIQLGISDFIVKPSNHINLLVKARMYMDER